MRRLRFMVFDRWGRYQQDLTGIAEATLSQEINSTDELDITVPVALSKGDHILWRDETWHEHVVNEQDQEHEGSQTMSYKCEGVHQWLRYDHIRLFVMTNVTAEEALTHILEQTTWEVGTVEDFGRHDLALSQTDTYKALLEIAGTWGCEIRPEITVSHGGVTKRAISLVHQRGESRGARFEYGRDIGGVEKSVLKDDVITACYGYGKTLDTETDGVKDRLWCFVEGTDEQKQRWGQPDGNGGIKHSVGMYEDANIEDADELEDATRAYMAQHSAPSVQYKVSDAMALQLRGVELGDVIQTIDREFIPELRLEARVGEMKRDILTGDTKSATFGTIVSLLPDVLTRIYSQVTSVTPALTQAQIAANNAAQAAQEAEQKVTSIDQMLTTGALSIGGSVLSVVDGKIYLDGKELVVAE